MDETYEKRLSEVHKGLEKEYKGKLADCRKGAKQRTTEISALNSKIAEAEREKRK